MTESDIQEFRAEKSSCTHDAVFTVSESERFIELFRQSVKLEREDMIAKDSLTCFVVTEATRSVQYDAKLLSTRIIANEAIYPALDVRLSTASVAAVQAVS